MMEMLLGEHFVELLERFPDISEHVMKVAEKRSKRETMSKRNYNAQSKNGGIKNWRQISGTANSKAGAETSTDKMAELTRTAVSQPGGLDRSQKYADARKGSATASSHQNKISSIRDKWARVQNGNSGSHVAKSKLKNSILADEADDEAGAGVGDEVGAGVGDVVGGGVDGGVGGGAGNGADDDPGQVAGHQDGAGGKPKAIRRSQVAPRSASAETKRWANQR
jgi:hypothetical protein